MTDKNAKAAAFDKALRSLPDEMSTSDIGIFCHGLCTIFNADPEQIAALIMLLECLEQEQNEVKKNANATLKFKSEKLTEMFRGDAC